MKKERGNLRRFFPCIFSHPLRGRNTHVVCRELKAEKRRQAKYEKCARFLLAGRDATEGKNESKRHDATWESQIEQGACSKPNAALSSSFPSPAPRVLRFRSPLLAPRRGGYLDRMFAGTIRDRYASSLQLWSRRQVILNAASTGYARSVMSFPIFNAFIV